MNGFLCVLKPPGMTSSDAVLFVRKRLPRGTKVGHAGTLDPEAAGVLPIMIGKATRLFDLVTDKEKTYVAQWKPGADTDTQDAFGRVLSRGRTDVSREELEAVLPRFTGTVMQKPPMYSALKRDGKKLCDLARSGETVELSPRPVTIHSIRLLGENGDGSFRLEVHCGRGTYIRTLCQDIGEAIGCRAHMGVLLRTQCGPFSIEDTHTLEELDGADPEKMLLPMDTPISHIQAVTLNEAAEKGVRCGNPVPLRFADRMPEPGVCRLYLGDRFCGIGQRRGNEIYFNAMLLD